MKINSIPQVFSSNLNKNLNIPSYLRVGTSGDSFERTKPEVISSETLCQTLKTKGMKAKDAKKLLNMLINANMRCIDVKIAHSITNIYEETKDIEDLFYIVSIGSNNEYVKKNERVKFFDTVEKIYLTRPTAGCMTVDIAVNLALASFQDIITKEDIEVVSFLTTLKDKNRAAITIADALKVAYSVNYRDEKTDEIKTNYDMIDLFCELRNNKIGFSVANALLLTNLAQKAKDENVDFSFEMDLIEYLSSGRVNKTWVSEDEVVNAILHSENLSQQDKNAFRKIIDRYYGEQNYGVRHDMNSCIEIEKLRHRDKASERINLYLNMLGQKMGAIIGSEVIYLDSKMAADIANKHLMHKEDVVDNLATNLFFLCKGKLLELIKSGRISFGDVVKEAIEICLSNPNGTATLDEIRKIIIEKYSK